MASYFFYSYSTGFLVIILIFSTLLDFYCGKAIYHATSRTSKKFYLTLSIIVNLGLLGIFKYLDFSIQNINYFASLFGFNLNFPLLHIILPIGISFYTFQTMSYGIDIYFKKMKPTDSLLKFGMYVTFFPQLVAGPIVRAKDFIPQLTNKVKIIPENFKNGLTLVGWGLVKKIVFADNIAVLANALFLDPTQYTGSIPAFLGALAFGIQIYCDFSGYSDIAIGIARILGFELKLNFDQPYFARNISEFWAKWHISLSTWLKDYLYIPLGGNRKGKFRTYVNLTITMILGGLWHGAAWNFLFWGLYQGMLLCLHKFFKSIGATNLLNIFGRFEKYLSLLLTQYFVFLGWLIFRVSNVDNLKYVVKQYLIFDFSNGLTVLLQLLQSYEIPLFFLLLFLIVQTYAYLNGKLIENIAEKDLFYWGIYLFFICMALYFLSPAETAPFIYFQF